MDYKSTLNLPKTEFPMKGNLPQSEPKMLARWEREDLYGKIQQDRKGAAPFILHDGPPYANGDIHIGHALNKILKDVIVRYQTMQSKRVPYVPGWDCHGLPIEYALMKELQVTKHQVKVTEFRKKARAYAKKYVEIQREQFKRLGVTGDWAHPYLTLEPGYVAAALRALAELRRKGFIYRARRPVNWCWSCETALAEAEVEYEDREDQSVYVKFPVDQDHSSIQVTGSNQFHKRFPLSVAIWTTTPWTLPANMALCFHPDELYARVEVEIGGRPEHLILADKLVDRFLSKTGLRKTSVPWRFEGKRVAEQYLDGPSLRCTNPLFPERASVGVTDIGVNMDEGTGIIHIAPGHGEEDFHIGHRSGLSIFSPVDARGRFDAQVPRWQGKGVFEATPEIIKALSVSEALLHQERVTHSYPHCWRCHEPIIFRATDQWFLKIEQEGLRGKLLEAIARDVRWVPPAGRERIAGMVRTRPDWCLSRQRLWGIPIPAVICASCGGAALDPRIIESFAAAIESDPEGSDRWLSDPVTRWLPERFTCACGSNQFDPGTDILDVWFDSGVSHLGVLKRRPELGHPADLYLEGSDQHRGWFQVSLITAVALTGKPPYRGVLTHGFVVDGEGRKMSKSLGNVIAPQEVISSMGAEVLRLWVASSDYAEDIRISPQILDQVSETYRKIRNTIRYLLANVSDFRPEETPVSALQGMERWILCELRDLVEEATLSYDSFAFHRVVKRVHEFCTVRLSNFYLDVVKDRLYTAHPRDPHRQAIQRALWEMARALIRLLAPILPVTAEEAWGALPLAVPGPVPGTWQLPESVPGTGRGSVHRERWPRAEELPQDTALQEEWRQLLGLRDEAMKELERAREAGLIGEALEADLEVRVRDEGLWRFLGPRQKDLEAACIVSGLAVRRGEGAGAPVEMEVRKAAGAKCQRCWMRLPTVGRSPEHPGLCDRCVAVLQRMQLDGKL